MKKNCFMAGIFTFISMSAMAENSGSVVTPTNDDWVKVVIYKTDGKKTQEILSDFSVPISQEPSLDHKNNATSSKTRYIQYGTNKCEKPYHHGKCKLTVETLKLKDNIFLTEIKNPQVVTMNYSKPDERKSKNAKLFYVDLDFDELLYIKQEQPSELVLSLYPVIENHKSKFSAILKNDTKYSYLISERNCDEKLLVDTSPKKFGEEARSQQCQKIYMDLISK